jgi:hypothetical protein
LTLVGCGEGDGASDGQTGTAQAASACTDQRLASPTDVTLILDFLPTRSTSPHLPGAGRRQLQGQQHQPEDPDPDLDLDLGHATPAGHRLGRHRHRVVAGLPHLPLGGRRSLPQWPLQTTRNWTLRRLGHPAVVAGDIRTERRRPPRRHRGAAGPLPCRPPARSRPSAHVRRGRVRPAATSARSRWSLAVMGRTSTVWAGRQGTPVGSGAALVVTAEPPAPSRRAAGYGPLQRPAAHQRQRPRRSDCTAPAN